MAPFRYLATIFPRLTTAFIFIFFIYLASQFPLSSYFPIQLVQVYGANHADRGEIKNELLPLASRGFFGVQVAFIRDRLLQMPWVDDIFVRREWPDKIKIRVVEKTAVARWNDEVLLSSRGEIFMPDRKTYPADLPFFYGPSGHQSVVLKYYEDMNRILMPLHVKISTLEMTPYLSWRVLLSNGIWLQIGQKDLLQRLDHFVRVYPSIVGDHKGDVEYIDLRYPNGVAVRWKDVTKTQTG